MKTGRKSATAGEPDSGEGSGQDSPSAPGSDPRPRAADSRTTLLGKSKASGKGVKREAIEGSFLFTGPGKYEAPPSYFLVRGDPESHGSRMSPGFPEVITSGNPPTAAPPASTVRSISTRTASRRLAGTRSGWKNPRTSRGPGPG